MKSFVFFSLPILLLSLMSSMLPVAYPDPRIVIGEKITKNGDFSGPRFVVAMKNMTVKSGRDAVFKCLLENLNGYRVAWLKIQPRLALAMGEHVIIPDARLQVQHPDNNTSILTIKNVTWDDSGPYLCQINSVPVQSNVAELVVVVPPHIIDEESSSDVMVSEGASVKLSCAAYGFPIPTISWKRASGRPFNVVNDEQLYLTKRHNEKRTKMSGNHITLREVRRSDMDTYLCIASNSIPPMISKQIQVQVNFSPTMTVDEMWKAVDENATTTSLTCIVEAYPPPMFFWTRERVIQAKTNCVDGDKECEYDKLLRERVIQAKTNCVDGDKECEYDKLPKSPVRKRRHGKSHHHVIRREMCTDQNTCQTLVNIESPVRKRRHGKSHQLVMREMCTDQNTCQTLVKIGALDGDEIHRIKKYSDCLEKGICNFNEAIDAELARYKRNVMTLLSNMCSNMSMCFEESLEAGELLTASEHYQLYVRQINNYTYNMTLGITGFTHQDYGRYRCYASNSISYAHTPIVVYDQKIGYLAKAKNYPIEKYVNSFFLKVPPGFSFPYANVTAATTTSAFAITPTIAMKTSSCPALSDIHYSMMFGLVMMNAAVL